MEWRPISEAPEGTKEILAVNARTGEMQLTQREDLGWRRGFRHRNGFNEATHFLAGIPPVPIYDMNDLRPPHDEAESQGGG
jgi:hypothetical protein